MRQRLLELSRHGVGVGEKETSARMFRAQFEHAIIIPYGLLEGSGEQIARQLCAGNRPQEAGLPIVGRFSDPQRGPVLGVVRALAREVAPDKALQKQRALWMALFD